MCNMRHPLGMLFVQGSKTQTKRDEGSFSTNPLKVMMKSLDSLKNQTLCWSQSILFGTCSVVEVCREMETNLTVVYLRLWFIYGELGDLGTIFYPESVSLKD